MYVNLGANIAHTGSILIHDTTLAGLEPALYPALLRPLPPSEKMPYYLLPGFYVPVIPRGEIIPEFYPLHPVWQAIGYALGGIRAELLITPLWGLLGCLALYLTARQLWGRLAGLLALFGLSATALQIWFARYPTSEMLTQYLFWTCAWAFSAWIGGQQPRGLWAGLAGLALGELFLTRIDLYFLLLVLPVTAIWWHWNGGLRRQDSSFFVFAGLLAAQSLAHGAILSKGYFLRLLGYSLKLVGSYLGLAGIALLLGIGVLLIFEFHPSWRHKLAGWLLIRHQIWSVSGALLVTGLAAYGYFLRPHLGTATVASYWYGGGQIPNLDHENFLRLGWYLSPIGLLLGVGGLAWLLIKDLQRRTAFVLGTGLFFALVYLWRIQANPQQIYAMRRYMPIVVPFLILASAFLVNWLAYHLPGRLRWLSGGVAIVWLVSILLSARGFVSQIDFRGIIGQLDTLSTNFRPHSVLIFKDPAPVGVGDFLGTPLRFLYGYDVFTWRDEKALDKASFSRALEDWRSENRTVYFISEAPAEQWPLEDWQICDIQHYKLETVTLESIYDRRPTALVSPSWGGEIATVERSCAEGR